MGVETARGERPGRQALDTVTPSIPGVSHYWRRWSRLVALRGEENGLAPSCGEG